MINFRIRILDYIEGVTFLIIFVRFSLGLFQIRDTRCTYYCEMSLNFGDLVSNGNFDSYYLQKSFFSALTYLILKVAGISITAFHINLTLYLISSVCIFLIISQWFKICGSLHITRQNRILGLQLIILNPLMMYSHFYYFSNPDIGLLILGLLIVKIFLFESRASLFICYLLAIVIAPQVRLFLLLFLMIHLIKPNKLSQYIQVINKFSNQRVIFNKINKKIIKRQVSIPYGLIFIFLFYVFLSIISSRLPDFLEPRVEVNWFTPVSIIFATFILFYSFNILSNRLEGALQEKPLFDLSKIQIFIFVFTTEVFRLLLINYLGNGPDRTMTSYPKGQLYTLFVFFAQPIDLPGISLLAPINSFGVVFVLALAMFVRNCKDYSVNYIQGVLLLTCILFLPYFLETESRHHIFILPLLFVLTLRRISFSPIQVLLLSFISVLNSRFWLQQKWIELEPDFFGVKFGPWFDLSSWMVSFFTLIIYYNILKRFFNINLIKLINSVSK